MHIPELDHYSGSWVVSRKKDGSVIGEFYDLENVKKFNTETCNVETALQYLQRINCETKQSTPQS